MFRALILTLFVVGCVPASSGERRSKSDPDVPAVDDLADVTPVAVDEGADPGIPEPEPDPGPDLAEPIDEGPLPPELSCAGRCGDDFGSELECQCNDACIKTGSCCTDWKDLCEPLLSTCEGRCFTGFDGDKLCQCNWGCLEFGNCCDDFPTLCEPNVASCQDRCGEDFDEDLPCQCQLECAQHGNCCLDYAAACNGGLSLDWIAASPGACSSGADWFYVVNVSDGDTLVIEGGAKVRLVSVDTPEISGGECFAWDATDYSVDKLEGKEVCLVSDPSQPDTDDFGRLLRNVYYPEETLDSDVVLHDARLVRLGLARVHFKYIWGTSHDEQTMLMEVAAWQEGIGGWSSCGWTLGD